MNVRHTMLIGLLAASTLALGACSGSGDETPPSEEPTGRVPGGAPASPGGATSTPTEGMDDRNALMTEYQEIQQRIGALQQQAMADPELQETYADLESEIEQEMMSTDPEYKEKQGRLQELQAEMSAAQQAGDEAAMQTINQEGMALQTELQQLRASVFQDEEIAAEVEAFRDSVEVRMAEIDPETPELIERASEIASELQGAAAPGSP